MVHAIMNLGCPVILLSVYQYVCTTTSENIAQKLSYKINSPQLEMQILHISKLLLNSVSDDALCKILPTLKVIVVLCIKIFFLALWARQSLYVHKKCRD